MKIRALMVIAAIVLFNGAIQGQAKTKTEAPSDTIISNIVRQLRIYPQEKLHLHTDKTHYVSGENIWFRAYLVNALSHFPEISSRYIYVDLVSPVDTVVARVMIRPTDSLFHGHFPLVEGIAEGSYMLRAYTNFMKNLGDDYFFKKNIYISDPLAATVKTVVNFDFSDNKKQIEAEIKFVDLKDHTLKIPDKLSIKIGDKSSSVVKMDKDNVARISFKTPKGNKREMILVEYDKHKKYIEIPRSDDDFDVSFFPEGGYLQVDRSNTVGFKSLNTGGLSEEITGEVFDDEDNKVASIKTLYKGMGYMNLLPEKGRTYYVMCKSSKDVSKRFELPVARNDVYTLKIISHNKSLLVSVQKPLYETVGNDSLFLLIHSKGITHYAAGWDNSKEYIYIDQSKLPSGVLQVLLFDANMNPLSERLFFCQNDDQAKVSFETDKQSYGARQHILSKLKVSGGDNTPLAGSLSVSVTDDKDVQADTCSTILTSLLLTSELKGHIESPGYYFQNNKQAKIALDVLMLTQGWRRYNIPEVVKGKFERPTEPLEIGQEVSGIVKGLLFTKAVSKSKVSIISPPSYFDITETDKEGRFQFRGFEYPDSTKYFVQALSKRGSSRVELFVDDNTRPPAINSKGFWSEQQFSNDFEQYIAKADLKYTYENGMRMVYLDEVVVTGRKEPKQFSMYSGIADNTFTAEQIEKMGATRLEDLLMRIPGVRVVGGKISIRNSLSPPKIVVDDIPMNFGGEEDENLDLDFININDIESIEVIKSGAAAVMLGSGTTGGAIVITTKRGDFTPPPSFAFNTKHIKPLGYQKPAEFYSPKYETPAQKEDQTPDLRTTIYWKPNIVTSAEGEASFDFYSADAATTYSVIIEGITDNGRIIRSVEKIVRK